MTLDIKPYHDLADLLLDLEVLMREAGVWESPYPSPEAMQSQIPFAADSMAFNQWLRYIMIEKFKELIELGAPLPASSNIVDYAVEVDLGVKGEGEHKILHCIRSIDQLLNAS